jgi:hypothetical protein
MGGAHCLLGGFKVLLKKNFKNVLSIAFSFLQLSLINYSQPRPDNSPIFTYVYTCGTHILLIQNSKEFGIFWT